MNRLLPFALAAFLFAPLGLAGCGGKGGGGGNPPDVTAPTVPQGLTATAASSTAIGLSWSPSSDDRGVAGYRLHRNGTTYQNTAATSFNDTGLTPATRYCYQVLAYDAANNQSGLGAEACATTPVSSADVTLAVVKAGTGSGTVTGPGISCGTDCSETVTTGTSIALTAAAAVGSTFASWSDCDTPSGATCTMSMTASKTVTATFSGVTPIYTVAIAQGENVSVSPVGTQRAYQGQTIDLTIKANSNGIVPLLLVNGQSVDMTRSGDDYLFTLTVVGDAEVYATSAVSPTLSPNAKAIDAATTQNLSSTSGGTLIFDGTTPYLDALKSGDVIMGGVTATTPYGLLRKVTTVTANGSRITVETAPASLEDVIENGEFIINEALTASNITSYVPLKAGVALGRQATGSLAAAAADVCFSLDQVLWDADGATSTTYDQVVADGQVCFSANFRFALSVKWFKVKHLTLSTRLGQTADLSFQSNVAWSSGVSIPVAEIYFGAITAGPLVFVPKLKIYIGADAALGAGISFGATENSSLTAGVSYDHDNGWNPIADCATGFSSSARPTVYARASANGYAALEFDFLLYGVAGTYATPKAYVGLDLEPLADPWLTVYGGISASAGIKAEVFGYGIQHDFGTLFDYRETLYALYGNKPPMIASFTASPGTVATQGTSTIVVVASDPENDPFECTWSTDGGTLSSTAGCGSVTWTAPQAPGTYGVSVSVADNKSNYNPTTRSVSILVPPSVTLFVNKTGDGSGRVTGNHIDCGTICSETCFGCIGPIDTLSATPDRGSTFTGWSGCNNVVGGSLCQVYNGYDQSTWYLNKTVTATFAAQYGTLSVQKAGTGSGTVTGTGIDCGSDCSEYLHGDITLTATPDSNSEFLYWTGTTRNPITLFIYSDVSVTATFGARRTLSVQKSGDGSGTVTGGGIDCGSNCSLTVSDGTSVTLTATPGTGSVFASWSGCDSTSGNTCTASMNQNRNVTAVFQALYSLSVQNAGSGTGSVDSSPQGRDCGNGSSDCYISGAAVTLTATPWISSSLTSWSGCDSTSGNTCTVTMTRNRTVTATFTLVHDTLSVQRTGTGSGTVTGTGINCGSDCSEVLVRGSSVTLTATPSSGSALTSWSGCDSTNGNTCTVTSITQDRTIAATFSLNVQYYTLSVQRAGTGSGTVTGGGIDCGSTCSLTLAGGTAVTLTATPSTSSSFASWTGCDSANGNSCTVTVTQSRTVTATFTLIYNTLTIQKGGCGSGTVTGPGIDCGSDCSETVTRGTTVTLGSNPDTGSVSAGMYRGTSRLYPANTVTVLGDETVSAMFGLQAYNVCVQPAGTGNGTVRTGDSMRISCSIYNNVISGTCSGNLPTTGDYYTTLYATPASGSSFGGWTGPCFDTGTDYNSNPTRYWCRTIWIGVNGYPFEAFIATFE